MWPGRPQLSIATAIVFYHRFYARESYEAYERFQVATTCLFLASKVEETPKKLREVIIETYKVQHSTTVLPENDQEIWRLKEQVLICERELLRVLGFDLSVEHAYRCAPMVPAETLVAVGSRASFTRELPLVPLVDAGRC